MASTCISDPRDLRQAVTGAGEARDALITELTIGETFFLREPGQFDFLRTTVLSELRSTIGERRLRVWSAGCATGEEPYSLAVLLKEMAWPAPTSILGTDLAAARLAAARRARYTAWSMRGVSDHIVSRYFERRGRQFILRSDIRQAVDFSVLNLASTDYPSAMSGVDRMDIVFCRNVLIYFDLSTVAAIASRLLASLAPGGWLFLGASDPSIAELVPCEVVLTGAGLAYRPAGTTAGARSDVILDSESWSPEIVAERAAFDLGPIEAWTPSETVVEIGTLAPAFEDPDASTDEPQDPRDSYESAYSQGGYDAAARLAREVIERGDDIEATWIVLVRSLANRGELEAAGEACAAALDRHRLSAELTHLHGILLAEAGRHPEAAVAARQALYLDPQYIVAHLALGDSLSRIGDTAHARRAFTNAERLLKGVAPDTLVAGADGAEASQLLGIARFRLQTLRVGREVHRK
jgi:chemotaxis protein methyltransferase CheR